MKFTFVLQLDPYKVDYTEVDGKGHFSDGGNERYRTVDWQTVPPFQSRVMIHDAYQHPRLAMAGFWCEVASHSYRRDGILLVNLSPAWPRDEPLPEEDGWTEVAPWLEPVEIETRLDGQGRRLFVGYRQGGVPVPPEQWPKNR